MAKRRKKKKSRGFAVFMLIYSIAFLAAAFYGIKYLWGYMESYERSRPINTVNMYMDSMDDDYWRRASAQVVNSVDHNIQCEEQCYDCILDFISSGVTYERDPANSIAQQRETYMLRCRDKIIGKLVFEPTEYIGEFFPHIKEFHSTLSEWSCTDTEFYFDWIYTDYEQVVPTGYTVYLNGKPLGDEYIVEDNIEYESLASLYDTMPELLHMRRYKAEGFVGELTLSVTDDKGQYVDLDTFVAEDLFTSNCSEAELERLSTFVNKFVKAYVVFSSNVDKEETYNNKEALQALIVPDTSLYTRIADAVAGLYWAHSKGEVIKSVTLNSAIKIDNSTYYCDVTYILDTTGQEGTFSITDNIRLVIKDSENGLKASSMYTY